MTPLIRKAIKFAPEPETAMWFDVGSCAEVQLGSLDSETFMHLPYKRTGIVGTDIKGKEFAVWLTQGEGSITVAGHSIHHNHYFTPYAYISTEDGFKVYQKGKGSVTLDDIKPLHQMVLAVMTKLLTQTTGYRPSPEKTFINAKRQRKGKSALTYDWHTVVIEPPQKKNEHQGGTHATPRLHQVRGHWRTYKSGKRGWVRECWKGDASKGTIFKDYRIKSENLSVESTA